jgi:heme A synthase
MKNPSLHRYAVLVAGSTLLLILSGAAITSMEGLPGAAATVPAPMWMETAHRILGSVVLLSTVALLWLVRKDQRGGLKWTAATAFVLCAGEAFLGNQAANLGNQAAGALPMIGVLHALLAQLLFTATAAVALLTAPQPEKVKATEAPPPAFRSLAFIIAGLVLLQVLLGDAYRHRAMGVILHILNAMIVALVIFVVGMLVTRKPETPEHLRSAAVSLMVVTGIQVLLGFAVFILLLMFPRNNLALVLTSVAHVATGALTLAASMAFALAIISEPLGQQVPSVHSKR